MLCLGKILQHPESNEAWKNRIAGVKSLKSCKDYDGINGEATEYEWNIFPGFTTMQLYGKITDLLSRFGNRKNNKDECLANAGVVKVLARKFGVGQWSFIDQVLKRSGILPRIAHKEPGTTLQNKCCWNLQKLDILLSVPQLRCPEAFSRAKDTENCRYIWLRIAQQLKQFVASFFLSISSASTEQCGEHMLRI